MARQRPPSSGRSGTDHPDDVFVARTIEVSGWAQRNSQLLVVAGIALALLVAGLFYYSNYRQEHQRQAVLALERIQRTRSVGELEVAKAELITYLDRFGSTPYAGEARLLLGQLYLEAAQVQQAIEVLGESAADLDEPIAVQAAVLLAKAYEEQGSFERAEEVYLRVADEARLDFQVRNALADAARLRTRLGAREGAAELYRRILEDIGENDPERGLYEMRLQEVLAALKV